MKKSKAIVWSFICLTVSSVLFLSGSGFAKEVKKDRRYYEERGEVVWEVRTNQKVIALTFDDGPHETYTPQILQLLEKYNAKATFFVVGSRVEKFPEITQRTVKEGHELANHTYSHPRSHKMLARNIQQEITKTQEIISSATGVKPQLFRPPGGFYNEQLVTAVNNKGFIFVLWSWHQDTKDWKDPGVNKIVNKVLDNARNGDIVLFHDHGGERHQTVAALKQILPELQKRGYQFITVSELLKLRGEPVKGAK